MTDVMFSQGPMASPTTMNSVQFPSFQPSPASPHHKQNGQQVAHHVRRNSQYNDVNHHASLREQREQSHRDSHGESSHFASHSTQKPQHAHFLPQSPQVQFPSIQGSTTSSNAHNNGTRWLPRRGSNARGSMGRRRSRAKSISEQTQEAVKVVAPPISITLVFLCVGWYLSSAVSNNLSKGILQSFKYPVTLTMLQFVYAALFSFAALALTQRRPELATFFPKNTIATQGLIGPESWVLKSTMPMAGFQIFGHILSLSATSQIPVSLVHAIKSLSPLLTVGVYTFAFGRRYNASTYLSLIPLTLGVIMACAAEFKARPLAIMNAFLSCVVFVSQNIWSKSLLTTGQLSNSNVENEKVSTSQKTCKLDKLNIIFWCAAGGFAGTLPIWLLTDGRKALSHGFEFSGEVSPLSLFILITFNGLSHFCQNLISFMILGGISTVAYSIASLLKRIFVMSVAIMWFGQKVTATQGWGIIITFIGLYVYDRFGSKTSEPKNESMELPK